MFTLNDYKSQSFKDLSDYLYNDRLQDFEPIAELEMTDDNLESIFKYRYGIKIFWAIVRMNSYLEQWFKVVSLNQWFPYNYKFRVCADGNIVPFIEENRTVKVYIYAYDEVIETDINTVLVTALTFAIFDHAEENPQNQGVWDNFESIKTLAFTSKCYDQRTYSKMID